MTEWLNFTSRVRAGSDLCRHFVFWHISVTFILVLLKYNWLCKFEVCNVFWYTYLLENVYHHSVSYHAHHLSSVQISSVAQSSLTLCHPMDYSMPGFPVHHQLLELAQTHVHQVGMPSNHLNLCFPLILLPSIFPSTRVFSNESTLYIRWPKYWNISFSISPSNEYSGLISYRIDWFYLLAVQRTLKSPDTLSRK